PLTFLFDFSRLTQWFDLTKDTLRDTLQITPVNNNNAFSSPPTPDALINFVNDLGYLKVIRNLSDVMTNDMFQPWRGVVNRAHIDYAERIWEEFTPSIQTFIKDKKNLTHHSHRKKKASLIVIPSVRFTKLIIYYLQSKHKFHPRPDSPLHLPNEEPVLGYLKYLAGEKESDPDSPALKPATATKKSNLSAPKADLRPPPSPAIRSKPGLATKRRKLTSSLSSVDESVDEGIHEKEPRFDDEEVDVQRALEESLKSVYDAPRGSLPPVVIREPNSGKYQPLPEVQGKRKEKFIFQRRTSTPTESFGHDESSLLYADSEVEFDEGVPEIDRGVQDEGQAGPNTGEQDEGRARPNPDVSTQPHPEQMDEGFTATAYPNVQKNLKLTVKEHVILEEPDSSTGTLSSLQHLAKDLSFGELFFNDKPFKADNEKTTAETEAESMVSVTIQQDTSSIPP
nr:hypothetical protein [Tanacetum cinerariifolium]